jgi:hypothetical protein
MIGDVSGSAALAMWLALVLALFDWYGAARSRRFTWWAKPAVTVALIGAAALMTPANASIRWFVVGALALAVLSDLAQNVEAIELGLGLGLLGNAAYTAAFLIAWHSWTASLLTLVLGLVLIAVIGRRIAAHASQYDGRVELLVLLSQVVLVVMAVIAFGTTNQWVMTGAGIAVFSDLYLNWTRFVGRESAASRLIVHLTGHVAQACFVISLVTLAKS